MVSKIRNPKMTKERNLCATGIPVFPLPDVTEEGYVCLKLNEFTLATIPLTD
jgi:hypothetical protein